MDNSNLDKIERTEAGMDNNGRDIAMDGLMKSNALDYKLPPNLSVVVRRQLIRSYANKTSFNSSENIIFIVNSGDMYVDGSNSYLTFQCGVDADDNKTSFTNGALQASARWGQGSACNVILSCTCTSASGTEIIREERVNAYRVADDRYGCSEEWLKKFGSIYGYQKEEVADSSASPFALTQTTIELKTTGAVVGVGTSFTTELSVGDYLIAPTSGYRHRVTAITDALNLTVEAISTLTAVSSVAGWTAERARDVAAPSWVGAQVVYNGTGVGFNNASSAPTFCIPMSRISGLFNTNKLLPAGLIGGMRIEISLETAEKALVWSDLVSATQAPQYVITNPTIMMDSYQLSDSVLKRLNAISASNGLEVVYTAVDNTQGATSSTAINIDSKRAVSRAMTTFLKVRNDADSAPAFDSMRSIADPAFSFSSFQFQLAGLFFPNDTIKTPEEGYMVAQYTWDKLKNCDNPNAVDLYSYNNSGDNLVSATLERSNVLALSGLPVSSSRILQCNAITSNTAARTLDMYMTYIKVSKVFLNKVVVRE